MRVNSESVSNEIHESDSQYEKHDEQRIRIWRGIMTPVIAARANARTPIWVMPRTGARQGKKTDEGTMISPRDAKSTIRMMTAANAPDGQTQTPATGKQGSAILGECNIDHCAVPYTLRSYNWPVIY
jgi:hypothetical protein